MAEFLSEKPTLDVQKLIDEIEDDITLAREEIDDILNGEYDETGQLEIDIDDALEADRLSTALKRNIGYINEKIQKIKDDRKPNLDKKTPANILKDEAFKNNEGGTKAERNVLSRGLAPGSRRYRTTRTSWIIASSGEKSAAILLLIEQEKVCKATAKQGLKSIYGTKRESIRQWWP